MIVYSDAELTRWWDGLTNQDRGELFDTIINNSWSTKLLRDVKAMREHWNNGGVLTPAQLTILRRWAR